MQQYREIKSRHQDAILFFRMGDFYEMFYDDAEVAARVLGLTLTSRNNGGAAEVPLAGVPVKALNEYLRRLVQQGFRVAICEQVEDPKLAKGIVRREVVETITLGAAFADDLLGFIGLGPTAANVWSIARWPAALLVAMLVFSFIYFITPDVKQRSWRWMTPGAVTGVLLWLLASWGFSTYLAKVADVGAIYGTFAGAIVLVAWIWLTNVALLFGAELNAEIERQKEMREGVPHGHTLNRPARQG